MWMDIPSKPSGVKKMGIDPYTRSHEKFEVSMFASSVAGAGLFGAGGSLDLALIHFYINA